MTPYQAISLLVECRSIAEKLLASGPNCHLDQKERSVLVELKAVKEAGLLDNYDVRRLAGLNEREIKALITALKRVSAKTSQ